MAKQMQKNPKELLKRVHVEGRSSSAFRDLQLMLSEALERPEPLSRKQRLEKARRGALYGQNPTGLFRRPEPKNQPIRNKYLPAAEQQATTSEATTNERIDSEIAAHRVRHEQAWVSASKPTTGGHAVWEDLEQRRGPDRDFPPEDWRPILTGPPRDWPEVTIASKANAVANRHANHTMKVGEAGVAMTQPVSPATSPNTSHYGSGSDSDTPSTATRGTGRPQTASSSSLLRYPLRARKPKFTGWTPAGGSSGKHDHLLGTSESLQQRRFRKRGQRPKSALATSRSAPAVGKGKFTPMRNPPSARPRTAASGGRAKGRRGSSSRPSTARSSGGRRGASSSSGYGGGGRVRRNKVAPLSPASSQSGGVVGVVALHSPHLSEAGGGGGGSFASPRSQSSAMSRLHAPVRRTPRVQEEDENQRRPHVRTTMEREVQQLRIKLHQEMSDIKNLLAAPHRVNSHTTRTETLGRFARKTAQRIATMTVDRHRSKRWHGPCNTCRVKHAKYDTKRCLGCVVSIHWRASRHGEPPKTVAGLVKSRSETSKTWMPSGAMISTANKMRRNDVLALLSARNQEADRRRESRPKVLRFFVGHRMFGKLDFTMLLKACRRAAKGPSIDEESLTAARAWKEENGIAHKPAVFVTRGQFMRAMRSSGFDSKADLQRINGLFSAYDVAARDYIDMTIVCTAFLKHQIKTRGVRFGTSTHRAGGGAASSVGASSGAERESREAAMLGGAGVREVVLQKVADSSDMARALEEELEGKRDELDVRNFFPND